jgi:hypothetical protein
VRIFCNETSDSTVSLIEAGSVLARKRTQFERQPNDETNSSDAGLGLLRFDRRRRAA